MNSGSKRRLSRESANNNNNRLKLDSTLGRILKIDSAQKGRRQRRDGISKQVSRLALAEVLKNSPTKSHLAPPDLKTFLSQHEDNVKVFREFLESQYCQENLDFYLACEKYHKLASTNCIGPDMVKFMATQIYNDFLSQHSRQPINVSNHHSESIQLNLRTSAAKPDLFAQVQAEVYDLMRLDCYPRFCKTWQLDRDVAQMIVSRNQGVFENATSSSANVLRQTRSVRFQGSQISIASSSRSSTLDGPPHSGCPPDCPYFCIGRLPCQQHGRLTCDISEKRINNNPMVATSTSSNRMQQMKPLPPTPPPPVPARRTIHMGHNVTSTRR